MDMPFPGLGTLVNAVAVIAGSLLGMAAGQWFDARARTLVTDCLGLVCLLMAGMSAASVGSPALADAVGPTAPVLVVLAALVLGGILGSALRLEERLERLAGAVGAGATRGRDQDGPSARERFVEGWLTATLLFCVGPLTILGSLQDGLGRGIDQLVVKSSLDFFASIAFASSFGVGVLFSAVSVLVVQGLLTLAGALLGAVMPESQIMALTATGGLMLVGISLRLLDVRRISVGDLLPALLLAPVLTAAISALR